MADGTRGAKRVAATLGPEQGREPDELERLVAGTLQGLVAAAPEAAGGVSWVNPKQSARVVKRRRARLKFKGMEKSTRARADYAYESRHRHACNRQRDANGRFPRARRRTPLLLPRRRRAARAGAARAACARRAPAPRRPPPAPDATAPTLPPLAPTVLRCYARRACRVSPHVSDSGWTSYATGSPCTA